MACPSPRRICQALVRHTPSGRFLAEGGLWTDRLEQAVAFASEHDAGRFLAVHACEPAAWTVFVDGVAAA
jgi:hypothetical protein